MKIFTWIHRKVHSDYSKISCDRDLPLETKKSRDTAAAEKDTAVLLLHAGEQAAALVDVLGDGFLAIGTFGLEDHQIHPFESEDEPITRDKVDEKFSIGEDEQLPSSLPPLMVRPPMDELEAEQALDSSRDDGRMLESQPLMRGQSDDIFSQFLDSAGTRTDEGAGKKLEDKKGRTTLADLFMADSAIVAAQIGISSSIVPIEKAEKSVRRGSVKQAVRSLRKRLMRGKATEKDPNQTSNFVGLMKKVYKRKVHPDAQEGKTDQDINTAKVIGFESADGSSGSHHKQTVDIAGVRKRSASLFKGASEP